MTGCNNPPVDPKLEGLAMHLAGVEFRHLFPTSQALLIHIRLHGDHSGKSDGGCCASYASSASTDFQEV